MKKGTILKNLWAGYETYFIYMGFPVRVGRAEASKVGGYSLSKIKGKWIFARAQYYRKDIINDREHFPVVGHIDLDSTMTSAILAAIQSGGADNATDGRN